MKKLLFVFLCAVSLFPYCLSAELPTLQDEMKFPDAVIAPGKYHSIKFRPMPDKPGKRAVLRFELVAENPVCGGCNFTAFVSVNSYTLTRWTKDNRERMIGRAGTLKLKGHGDREFQIFKSRKLLVMFAPDAASGNTMTQDGLGATYMVEISDMLYKNAYNSVTIHNLRTPSANGKDNLILTNVSIGWLDIPKAE